MRGDSLIITYWNGLKRPCWEIPNKPVSAVELDESASDFVMHLKTFMSIINPAKIARVSTYIFIPLLDNRVSVIVDKESASSVYLDQGPSGLAHPYHISCIQDWLVREQRWQGKKLTWYGWWWGKSGRVGLKQAILKDLIRESSRISEYYSPDVYRRVDASYKRARSPNERVEFVTWLIYLHSLNYLLIL